MKLTATEQGLLIPKELLGGVQEFELRRENDRIVVIPLEETDGAEALDDRLTALEQAGAFEERRPLSDFLGLLKDSPTFNGDPVEIQRKMRDEWS
jgi:virulence-associated protein VagC